MVLMFSSTHHARSAEPKYRSAWTPKSCNNTTRTSSGGFGSWLFQTTIGTEHDSHSAIQHRSSSYIRGVMGAASHSSQ